MTLKECRDKVHMTQYDLAKRCGVAQAMISMIESGLRRPSPELATKFAAEFSLPYQEIWNMFYSKSSAKKSLK